jgi:hypothetical protein
MNEESEVPARKVPPIEWSVDKKMFARRKWINQQGGTKLRDSEQEISPLKDLSTGEDDLPREPYREHFDPPLKNIDAESVPPDDVPDRIHDYRARFVENGDFLDPCKHLTDRELLRWIEELTKTEFELVHRAGTGVFQLYLSCPDCVREMERERSFDPDQPGKFLDGDVQPVEPETVEPGQFSNPEIMALSLGPDDALSPQQFDELSRSPDQPEEDPPVDQAVEQYKNDPVHEELVDLHEECEEYTCEAGKDGVEIEFVPIVRNLIRFADFALDRSYDFRWEFEDHDWNCCIRGAYRYGQAMMDDVLEILSQLSTRDVSEIRRKARSLRATLRETDPVE